MINFDPSISEDFVLETMLGRLGETTFPQGQATLCVAGETSSANEDRCDIMRNILTKIELGSGV
jgi:hypothetical protein